MIQKSLQEEMQEILPISRIRYNELMSRHCSFHTGGPADALAFVRTEREMAELLALLRDQGEEFYILGRGTNLLIGDGGYRGVIVSTAGADVPEESPLLSGPAGSPSERSLLSGPAGSPSESSLLSGPAGSPSESSLLSGPAGSPSESSLLSGASESPEEDGASPEEIYSLSEIRVQENRVIAGAGATLKAVAIAARDHGLAGLEFAAGIPGSVGGGLVMNAGAYDGEMSQVVRSVRMLMPDGTLRVMSGEEMEFGYRTSFLRKVSATALGAVFELEDGDPELIRARILELAAERRAKQPLEFPSAGSTFKRPEGFFAGKLIMDAGLRGYSVGGAQVSEKHCGFVINRGGATSADICQLIRDVQRIVFEAAGVELEREVIFLGEF